MSRHDVFEACASILADCIYSCIIQNAESINSDFISRCLGWLTLYSQLATKLLIDEAVNPFYTRPSGRILLVGHLTSLFIPR
jgi:hypothetical protein